MANIDLGGRPMLWPELLDIDEGEYIIMDWGFDPIKRRKMRQACQYIRESRSINLRLRTINTNSVRIFNHGYMKG